MDYYRRIAFQPNEPLREMSDDVYLEKMEAILSAPPSIGVPPDPSELTKSVYLGTQANAENMALLKSKGFTHLLNCAGGTSYTINKFANRRIKKMYPADSGLHYMELSALDCDSYHIRQHFERALGFIEHARLIGGKTLIYCPGVSRSGAIALAYLTKIHTPLLEATQMLKKKRRVALCNTGFMKQLIQYAKAMGMLDMDVNNVKPPRYMRQLDRPRVIRAHLPTFL